MIPFSDTSQKNGLIQLVEHYTGIGDGGISGDATLLKQVTGLINNWYGIVVGDILDADGRWQFDDFNHTDQPTATTSLVADQSEYSFISDENAVPFLRLIDLAVKDTAGNWIKLKPIDPAETNQAWDEYKKVSGIPTHFDMLGATIRLKPAPDYSQTASLKATFQREPSYFESTDTTKKPGFASVGHIILAMGAAYDWGISKGKANTSILRQEVEQRREEIRAFYSRRNKYEQPQLSAKYTSSR